MPTHRHSVGGKYTSYINVPIPEPQFTAAEVKALKLLAIAGGTGGTTPIPNPPPPPPPPDVTAPGMSNIAITPTGPTTATITLTTSEASTVRVLYGTTTALGSATGYTASGTSHTINLTGLTALTRYYVTIEALDTAGNLRSDTGRSFSTQDSTPVSGYQIQPGTGTIAAAIAAGQRTLVLRGGIYRDAFGPTPARTDVVKLTAYPGELPIIDGTGLVPHFAYFGTGADWRIKGIRFQNFPINYTGANGTAIFGIQQGYLELDQVTVQYITAAMDSLCHIVYAQGTGSCLIRDSKLLGSIGAAVTSFTGSATVTIERSELTALYRALLIYHGPTTATDTIIRTTNQAFDVEVSAPGTVALTRCVGGGANGAVRRIDV